MAAALTIAVREARVITRRARTWHLRWIVGALGIVAMLAAFWLSQHDASAQGNFVFVSIGVVAQLYATFAGVIVAADAIAAERREQTLGLLFLTDLRPRHVLLGKWLAASTTTICGLLVIVPFLAVPMLIGGVTPQRVLMLAGELLNTLLLSLSVGFLVSSLFRSGWLVLTSGILWMLNVAVIVPSLMMGLEIGDEFAFVSPTAGLLAIVSNSTTELRGYWQTGVFNHAITWGNFAIVGLRLAYIWRDRPHTARQQKRATRIAIFRFGANRARLKLRAQLLDQNPLSWLVNREQVSSSGLLAIFGAVFFAVLVAFYFCESYRLIRTVGIAVGVLAIAHLALIFRMGLAAAYDLAEDRKSGALELLLSTPIRPAEIVQGRWLGLFRRFLGPIVILFFFQTILILALIANLDRSAWQKGFIEGVMELQVDESQALPLILILSMLIMPLNWIAAGWLGMWLGLRVKKPIAAVWMTLNFVLFPPWIVLAATCLSVIALGLHEDANDWLNLAKVGLAAFILSALNAGFFMHLGRRNLLKYFRAAAADRFLEYRKPFPWGAIGRWTFRTACLLVALAAAAIWWRAGVNRRAESRWQEARAAHPEFSLVETETKTLVTVPPELNLAQCALLKPLDKPYPVVQYQLNRRRRVVRENYPILALRNPFTASFPGKTNVILRDPHPFPDRPWSRGEFENLQALETYAFKRGILTNRAGTAARSIMEIYKQFEPIISELHAEAARRPEIQFQFFPAYLGQINTTLSYRAIARLRVGENAIDDITLMLRLAEGSRPTQRSYGSSIMPVFQPLFEGLAQRRWNEDDLKHIQSILSRINLWDTLNKNIVRSTRTALEMVDANAPDLSKESHFHRAAYFFKYQAKLARAKAEILTRGLEVFPRVVNTNKNIIDLRLFREALADIETPDGLPGLTLPDSIGTEVSGFGFIQATLYQIQVACALERFRLRNQHFPESLAELEPAFIQRVPLDIMTGHPMIYHLSEDGQQFELYSVGIDGIDNGGMVGEFGETRRVDWVWNPLKRPESSPRGSRGE